MALKTPRCGKQASLHFTSLVLPNGESSCDDAKKGISGGVTLVRASLSRVVLAYESGSLYLAFVTLSPSSHPPSHRMTAQLSSLKSLPVDICLYPSCLLT